MHETASPIQDNPSLFAAGGTDQAILRGLARREPLVVAPASSLRETLYQLSQRNLDAAIVCDSASGLPLGLIRLRDMLHVISFEGGGLDDPVAIHMVGAPLTLSADASVHRARVMMARRGAEHLVLTEPDGRLHGLVAQADLLGLRAGGTEELIATIKSARDVAAMALATDRVRRRGAELFRAGMGVAAICEWMSGLNDLITMRIIELIEDEHDLPAVPWCWLAFGSEGRLEQTFATDQDNGLLFVPPDAAMTEAVRAAFLPFAEAVNRALHHCGFERCRGNIMAGNPDCCLSADEWQRAFTNWMYEADPEAVLKSTIFFDFRPLYGSDEPVDRLRDWLSHAAPEQTRFLHCLAAQALEVSPPLGWAGQFTFDRNRDFPHTIDLKLQGARFFMDAGRLWSLKHGISATATAERLRLAGAAQRRDPADVAAEIEGFELIQRFRIHQQIQTKDQDAINRVDPDDLNELHRLMLKESFRQAKRLQSRLRQEFGL
ncbi:MAG: CBS domain-containing protein [Sphingobacteriia bacterium]|nr:CBS domain-containing protein [Sphingobacteriia bacterium]NCC38451.1 CBS domain-containing protein [Gammaproteobacteria bacterium]